jgi:hypothetical protein
LVYYPIYCWSNGNAVIGPYCCWNRIGNFVIFLIEKITKKLINRKIKMISGIFGYQNITDCIDPFCDTEIFNHERDISNIAKESKMDNWGINITPNKSMSKIRLIIDVEHNAKLFLFRKYGYSIKDEICELPDIYQFALGLDFTKVDSFIAIHNYCSKRFREIISALHPELSLIKPSKY